MGPDARAGELLEDICRLVPPAVDNLWGRARRGDFAGQAQDQALVSTYPKRSLAHARIHWQRPARQIHNLVRGLCIWPQARFECQGQEHQVAASRLIRSRASGALPGAVLALEGGGTRAGVACGDGAVIQLQGIFPPLPPGAERLV